MAKEGTFATDAVRLTVSKLIGNLLVLASAMLLARVRTLDEYGTYSALMLVTQLAAAVFMLGLPNSINYFLAKAETRAEKNRFLSLYLTLSTALSAVLGVALLLLTPLFASYFKNPDLKTFGFFLLIYPWERVIMAGIENILVVLGKTRALMGYRISNSAMLLFIIALVWLIHGSFLLYMILYLVVEGAYALAVYGLASRYTGKLQFLLDSEMLRRVLAFSLPLGLASVVGTLNIEIDKLMLGHLLTTDQLAIYANASKELPLTIVASSLTAVLMPKMVRLFKAEKNLEAVAIWRDVTTISYAIMAFFAFGLAAFATEAMTILYSEKYAPGGLVFAIYSLGLLLKCTYFGLVLNTTGNTRLVLWSAIGALAVNVVLNWVLYLLLGMIGPALATLISAVLMNLFQLVFSCKITGIPFSAIFPWRNVLLLTGLNLLFSAVFLWIHKTLFPGAWQAVVLAAVWGILYAGLLFRPGIRRWRELSNL